MRSRALGTGLAATLALAVILLLVLLLNAFPLGERHEISVDGQFDDWSRAITIRDGDGPLPGSQEQLLEYALYLDDGRICAYAKTSHSIGAAPGGRVLFALETSAPLTMNRYEVHGVKADQLVSLIGDSGEAETHHALYEDSHSDTMNWTAWSFQKSTPAAAVGDGRVEGCVPSAGGRLRIENAAVMLVGTGGLEDVGRFNIIPGRPSVLASLSPAGYVFQRDEAAFDVELLASGGAVAAGEEVRVDHPAFASSSPRLGTLPDGGPVKVAIKLDAAKLSPGALVTTRLRPQDLEVSGHLTISEDTAVTYFASAPAGVVVDGAFTDWGAVPGNDIGPGGVAVTADLRHVAATNGTAGAEKVKAFHFRFDGQALGGSVAPTKHTPPSGGNGTVIEGPKVQGKDRLVAFVDEDNSTSTGQKTRGLGADIKVEVEGREGRVGSNTVFTWTGSAWAARGPAPLGLRAREMELGVPKSLGSFVPGFRYAVETTDWSDRHDSFGASGRDPVIARLGGTGYRGDIGSWSSVTLPPATAIGAQNDWVDVAESQDGEVFILRDDGAVWFSDTAATNANWAEQTGPGRPAGRAYVAIDVERNSGGFPLNVFLLRNDGLLLRSQTGPGFAAASWNQYGTTGLPAGTAYVDVGMNRFTPGQATALRNDGSAFYTTGGVWNALATSGLPAATDYASITGVRVGDCGGGDQQGGLAVMRSSGSVYCIRTNGAASWTSYGGPPTTGSFVSLADDSAPDTLYAMRSDGKVYRSDGSGVGGAWSTVILSPPASTSYVGVSGPSRGAANADTAHIIRAEGSVYLNTDTAAATAWTFFGTGNPAPSGGGAWVSVGGRDSAGIFLLATNGSVYRSVDAGASWSHLGDAGTDYSWVSVDATAADVYVMRNTGLVRRAPVGGGAFADFGSATKTISTTDASWVSLGASCDGVVGCVDAVRALRNDGSVETAPEATALWAVWGDADSVAGQYDLVGIASDGIDVYVVANHGAVSTSPATAFSWGTNAGAWVTLTNASWVDVAATDVAAGWVWLLRNDGEVLRSSDSASSFTASDFAPGSQASADASFASLAAVPERGGAIGAAAIAMVAGLIVPPLASRRTTLPRPADRTGTDREAGGRGPGTNITRC